MSEPTGAVEVVDATPGVDAEPRAGEARWRPPWRIVVGFGLVVLVALALVDVVFPASETERVFAAPPARPVLRIEALPSALHAALPGEEPVTPTLVRARGFGFEDRVEVQQCAITAEENVVLRRCETLVSGLRADQGAVLEAVVDVRPTVLGPSDEVIECDRPDAGTRCALVATAGVPTPPVPLGHDDEARARLNVLDVADGPVPEGGWLTLVLDGPPAPDAQALLCPVSAIVNEPGCRATSSEVRGEQVDVQVWPILQSAERDLDCRVADTCEVRVVGTGHEPVVAPVIVRAEQLAVTDIEVTPTDGLGRRDIVSVDSPFAFGLTVWQCLARSGCQSRPQAVISGHGPSDVPVERFIVVDEGLIERVFDCAAEPCMLRFEYSNTGRAGPVLVAQPLGFEPLTGSLRVEGDIESVVTLTDTWREGETANLVLLAPGIDSATAELHLCDPNTNTLACARRTPVVATAERFGDGYGALFRVPVGAAPCERCPVQLVADFDGQLAASEVVVEQSGPALGAAIELDAVGLHRLTVDAPTPLVEWRLCRTLAFELASADPPCWAGGRVEPTRQSDGHFVASERLALPLDSSQVPTPSGFERADCAVVACAVEVVSGPRRVVVAL